MSRMARRPTCCWPKQLAARPELRGEAFNFSNEIQITVLESGAAHPGVDGFRLLPEVRNEASNEIRHQYLSAEKARTVVAAGRRSFTPG